MFVASSESNEHDGLSIQVEEPGCDARGARDAVSDIISRHGGENILAVASIDGTMAVGGAVPAFKAQGLLHPYDDERHIPITTIDGTVPELQAHARGHIDHTSVQPAVGEGIMTMRLLWQKIRGEALSQVGETLEGDELWHPVNVVEHEGFKGPWFKTQVYTVPGDVPHDAPRIWSNQAYKSAEGSLPDFPE